MLDKLKAYAWQAATAAALVLCAAMGLTLLLAKHDLSSLRKDYAIQGDALVAIRSDLTTCRGNGATLEATIADTNARLAAQSAESTRRLKESGDALVGTLAALRKAQAKPVPVLTGADQCQRLLEVADKLKEQVR